ncbi:MAG: hypothetical protein B7Z66_13690 [Chromatiales bacterium 21-64-14]|nr:MAG: hypothetical protein B7Z66_13690 [Chromatiales bacterium 21-64-14]HQU15295.1 mitochondrial fission ELM1 family protein [Gammaproteobacteria bacterium]
MTTCWILSEDKAGMINQCLGLAEALGVVPLRKVLRVRAPWRYLPPSLWFNARAAPGPGSDPLTPPWPDLLIGSGHGSVALSIAIRRASGGRTYTVQIQDPRVHRSRFGLVVVPEHDRCRGANVLVTRGALHRVTPARLAVAASCAAPALASQPRPLVAVLLGGSNRVYRFTEDAAVRLAEQLLALHHALGVGIAVTPSRRTPPRVLAVLRERLAPAGATIWDGRGENPYFGYLALADFLLVTADSVSMVSEACSTGRPVYVVPLAGGSRKFRAFHFSLERAGITRPFCGQLETWSYGPLRETDTVAAEVRRRLQCAGSIPGVEG